MLLKIYGPRLRWPSSAIGLAGAFLMTQAARAENWLITKMDYPPEVLAHLNSVEREAQATDPTLEISNAPRVRKYREFLDGIAARNISQLEQIKAVNNYVNAHVLQKPDLELDGDVWAPPLHTLLTGGDCEDIALVKYWGLKRLGFAPQDMFLVMGMTLLTDPPEGHAVQAVRLPNGSYEVMYSLVSKVEDMQNLKYFEPAYALNEYGFWTIEDPGWIVKDYWHAAFARAIRRQHK